MNHAGGPSQRNRRSWQGEAGSMERRVALDLAFAAMRPQGRPPLSSSGSSSPSGSSPVIRVRVPAGLSAAIDTITSEAGADRAGWLRRALMEAALRDLPMPFEVPLPYETMGRDRPAGAEGITMVEQTTSEHDEPAVRYDVVGAVATITLNRSEAMNSLDTPTKELLLASVQQAAGDTAIRCVVLTGSGRAFCVGQDLREHVRNMAEQSLDEVWSTVERHYAPTVLAIATMEKPVIAALNGVAAGAGMSLALACDLRIAADTASFNTAFTAIALSCDTGISWTLPRLVGTTKAMELLLTPRKVSADEALAMGLLTSVVPAAELTDTVSARAARLAAGPTRAFAAVKRSLAFSATHALGESVQQEALMMAWTGGSADHRNAVDAFMAKQEPRFEGS